MRKYKLHVWHVALRANASCCRHQRRAVRVFVGRDTAEIIKAARQRLSLCIAAQYYSPSWKKFSREKNSPKDLRESAAL